MTHSDIIKRFIIFAIVFIIVSGIVGSWIVPTRLLYGFHFFIYGNLGKMVLISAIIFGLLVHERKKDYKKLPAAKTTIWPFFAATALLPIFFVLGRDLLHEKSFTSNIVLSLGTHLALISMPALLFLGIYGTTFIKAFAKLFKKQIFTCLGIALVLDVTIFQVWKLWPIFSGGVLTAVKFILSLTFTDVKHVPPHILAVNGFAVAIKEACSGLDSLFMFTALYALIGIVDRKKLNIRKLILVYPLAAIGMYLVNIVRVYILILIGALISPRIAIGLFHTYAGMILFISYFGIFWRIMYKRLLKTK